jgi:8-oxo-dGTP diphosphatase
VTSPADRAPAFDDATSARDDALPSDRRSVIRLAAYGVIRRADHAVLVCRISPGYPGTGRWTLPGGGLDFGEPPEAGAVREVEEETGLVARITGEPMILSHTGTWPRQPDVRYHGIRFVYPMEVVGGEERPEVGGSTDTFGWFTLDQLAGMPIVGLVSIALGLPVRDDEDEAAEVAAGS